MQNLHHNSTDNNLPFNIAGINSGSTKEELIEDSILNLRCGQNVVESTFRLVEDLLGVTFEDLKDGEEIPPVDRNLALKVLGDLNSFINTDRVHTADQQ